MFLKIERLNELISQDNTHPEDVERKALFLIISGNDELWNLRSQIYDFTLVFVPHLKICCLLLLIYTIIIL
jgi:hypothetical protein